ncbi:stage II sporulation protein P [Cytobacillus eiseniae]|uniref:Stage II sporulation protein P n=1 Tax=Cytobacillus eiseniae TaxID=762947 RepID=A0ABS4RFK8_9BACI|nr:stage II sporulation protein P [Cytobacillus eiseniae]MBP2241689.1 stage II sporulation protein P [Cytobacillus eiseniae]
MKPSKTNRSFVFVQGTSLLKICGGFLLFLLLIFTISGVLTSLKPEFRFSSTSVNTATNKVTGEMLYHFLGWENHHLLQGLGEHAEKPTLMNIVFKLSTNINLDDPRSLLGRELPSFSLYDSKIVVASEGTDYTNMPMESSPPLEVLRAEQEATLQNTETIDQPGGEEKVPENGLTTEGRKVVHLYFSHTTESYLPYLEGVTNPNHAYHSQLNVTKVGEKLKEELESRGIGTSIDKTDINAILNQKKLKHNASYRESRPIVQAAMAGNKDIQYIIDIHRDAQRKEHTTLTINGKDYAKLAFVVGVDHPNYEKNLKLATEMHNLINEKYPGLSRAVIQSGGQGTNGKFNQDLSEKAMLVEFGGVDNTFEELYLSAGALADVFSEFYWQAEKVSQPVQDPADKK